MKKTIIVAAALVAMMGCGKQTPTPQGSITTYPRKTKGNIEFYIGWERQLTNCVASSQNQFSVIGYFTKDSSKLENGPYFDTKDFSSSNDYRYYGTDIEEGFLYYRIRKYHYNNCLPKYSNNPIIPLERDNRGKILIEGGMQKTIRYSFDRDSITSIEIKEYN